MSKGPIRLVLSDVDGTLVTSDKVLTKETVAAVARLRENDVLFAVTSGRPPRGLSMLIEPLDLITPLAAFNGGLIVDRELHALQELEIADDLVGPLIEKLTQHDLSVWVFQGVNWFVLDPQGPHVQREVRACQFDPLPRVNFDTLRNNVVKVVGVSDDPELVTRARIALTKGFGSDVSATSSQTYYLDVTHRDANKGSVVRYLAGVYGLDVDEIATIGDMANDLLMFECSGLSIAMGNASDEVQRRASHVTRSNDENGFAHAVETLLLGGSS